MDRPLPVRHGARAPQARVLRLLVRESERSGACARVTRKPAAQSGDRSWHVVPRSRTEGERLSAGAVSFHRAWFDHNPLGTVRARGNLACCASSRAIASAVAHVLVSRESRLCKVEATAGTSYHGLATKDRDFLPVQCPVVEHRPTTTRPARRAQAESSRATPPPE